jgi:hypothetical protein
MSSRLQIINDALIATGNAPLNVEYDGSDEWVAAESAYRRAVGSILASHAWNFATTTVPLASALASSPSPLFEIAFALPSDCLHVEAVFLRGMPLSAYQIVDDRLCLNSAGDVSITYVRTPPADRWPLQFVEALTVRVEEMLLRGLNEEDTRADRRLAVFRQMIEDVKFQTDSQEGRRAVFKSSSAIRRMGGGPRGLRWPT